MTLLDAARGRPSLSPGVDRGRPHPCLRVLRRVGLNLLVACVIPGVVFYTLFVTFGVWPAIVGLALLVVRRDRRPRR